MNIKMLPMTEDHWREVSQIYLQGIRTKNATFETECPDWQSWNETHFQHCRLVAKTKNRIIGWAALSQMSNRQVYSGVAEVSIYVDTAYQGNGVGNLLLQELISQSEKDNIWTLQAGIFPENSASIALFKKNGFREVGIRKKIGKMEGQWRDVVLMERRSKVAGID